MNLAETAPQGAERTDQEAPSLACFTVPSCSATYRSSPAAASFVVLLDEGRIIASARAVAAKVDAPS